MELLIPAHRLPVLAEADVVVCGGGPAGVAAACSAARHGCQVVLLERWPSVGGMATNALVNIWHTSDRTRQVIFGLVQEAIERGGEWVHRLKEFPKTPETHDFDPEGMRLVFQRMLDDYGVRTLCNLTAVEAVVDDGRMRGVLVDTKTGRKAVLGRIFIDATGDGDVAANAGLPFDFGRPADGLVQGMTMMYRLCGIDMQRMNENRVAAADRVFEMMCMLRDRDEFPPFNEQGTRGLLRGWLANRRIPNMCPVAGNPLDEEELTRLTHRAREQVFAYLDLWRREMPGMDDAQVEQTGHALGVRESRRIRGIKTLEGRMVVGAVKQPDAVGHGFWLIDVHDPRGTGHTTWSDQDPSTMPPVGESYHIALGMCLNGSIPNLAVVGRCASSTHEGQASVRLQTHCMVMAQGVGTAGAMALDANVDMFQVNTSALQTMLRSDGAHIEDVPPE